MKQLISIIFVLLSFSLFSQEGWELVKEKEDMTVYIRQLEGSDFKEVKIDGKIACTLSEIVKAIEDVEAQSDWVESTIEAKILERKSSGTFVFYQGTDMPYPVKDRDVVMQYTRNQDPQSKEVQIDFTNVEGYKEKNSKYVRIPELHSSYKFVPEADGVISVNYKLKIDVGGKMPKWVVNMAITKGPIDTMEALFDAIRKGKYTDAVVDGVIN